MSKKRKKSGGKLLTILWLMTAASALIVTIVYFGRLQELYSAIGTIESQSDAAKTAKADEARQQDSGQKTEPGEDLSVGQPDTANEDITEALDDNAQNSEGQNPETLNPEAQNPEAQNSGDDKSDTAPAVPAVPAVPALLDDREHPYYYDANLDPSKPIIALSFDDGPSKNTERILAALDTYNSKATFFMVGYQIDAYSENVKAVYEAGCEIGNHTSDHKQLTSLSADKMKKQVYGNEDLINTLVPVGHIIVRPPYGDYNDTVKASIDRPMFNWSVDSLDWKSRNADAIVEEVKAQAKDGYIILCHDLYESTAEAVERFLPWLIEEGYQVTCISNMFEARGEEVLDGHIYRYTNPAGKNSASN